MSFRHDRAGTPAAAWREHPDHARIAAMPGLRDEHLDGHLDEVVVLAAHPDDESLGAGGLVASAHAAGLQVRVVVATSGEASHPHSTTHTPADLAAVRAAEVRRAVAALAPGVEPELLGLPDGRLGEHEAAVRDHLVTSIGDGWRTLVVAPWRHDGHPDHDAAGRAAAAAARRTGARLLEYPVWWWHWSSPDDADWASLRRLAPGPEAIAAKQRAMDCHLSQTAPLSAEPGDETLLSADFLAHFTGPDEVFVLEDPRDGDLDDLHAEHEDPWGVDHRWYEERKRALLLALLPRRRFRSGVEAGCSTGGLSLALAQRCETLLALDASPHALRRAAQRLADVPGAQALLADLPRDWPVDPTGEGYDLVVVSEVGYFLSPAALDGLIERVRRDLSADGVLVLCHWRHPVRGWVLDGADVHAAFREAGIRPVLASYVDRDVEVLVLASPEVAPDPGT